MMDSPRRLSLGLGAAFIAVALIGVNVGSGGAVTTDARRRAFDATRQLDSVRTSANDSARALSLAYLERARLGLGSPFRLIDQAIHDPRLDASTGAIVAWSIVDRLFDHGTYEVDAAVLDAVGPRGAGADHLALIERVIGSAGDPRVGEMTIRLAYGLAAAGGTISSPSLPMVTEVAALMRDRSLAERDLRQAIPRARSNGFNVIDELVRERIFRELDVERPLLGAISAADQDAAINDVPSVLREVAAVTADTVAPALSGRSLLDRSQAATISRLAERRPPTSAITVMLQTRDGVLRSDSSLAPMVRRIVSRATNEEALVAAYAYTEQYSGRQSIGASRVIVSAAVALRSLSQEPVWFPGDVVPGASQVSADFGLRRITFDHDVPLSWRGYYVEMMASALGDMRRVLPSYDPAGLSVRFVTHALPDSALAMHDPRTHTLILPLSTAAGTIGHELAHDLDWQSARRLFVRGGGYASDRSLAESDGPLGSSIRRLAAAHAISRSRGSATAVERPAEVFARGADWFIADALAHAGRTNGYLSTIQDQVITGYAAAPDDAASLSAATSLLSGLAEMTALPDSVARAYLDRWQSVDRLDPAALMARLRSAPVTMRRPSRKPFGLSSKMVAELNAPATCTLERLRAGTPRQRLLGMTIDAKARGILLRRAQMMAPLNRPAWAHVMLEEPVWDPRTADEIITRMIASVLDGGGRAGLVTLPPAPFRAVC